MTEQMKQFDVTTAEARKQALGTAFTYSWIPVFGPAYMLWKLASLYSTESTTREIESQRRTAIEIIRAGKENNVDELEITMSEKAGFSFGSSIEGFPIECTVGTSGNMTVKVKYK